MITIVRAQWLSRARLSDPMDWAHQAPPSMGFSRKEHWSSCHALLPPHNYYTVIKEKIILIYDDCFLYVLKELKYLFYKIEYTILREGPFNTKGWNSYQGKWKRAMIRNWNSKICSQTNYHNYIFSHLCLNTGNSLISSLQPTYIEHLPLTQ